MATGKELILKLKAKLNKLDTSYNRAVRPELALLFINDAFIKLVRAKYRKDNPGDITAFQYVQLTTDELDFLTLVKNGDLTDAQDFQINKVDEEYHINKSELENYFIHLKASIQVKSGNIQEWTTPNYKTIDEVNSTFSDPFNKTEFSDPVMYQEENKFKIIADDSFEIVAAKISYLKKPETITVDTVIDIPFEDELLDAAAIQILENWEDQRSQTKYQVDQAIKRE